MDRVYVIKTMDGRYACERDGVTRTGYLHNLVRACNKTQSVNEVCYIAMNNSDVDNFIDEVMNNIHNDMVDFIIIVNYL